VTEAEVVKSMREHLEGLFPKECSTCGCRFTNLRDFLLQTQCLGPAIPYDAEIGDWNPLRPIGTVTYANCRCGNTLVLSSEGMPLVQLWRLLDWARIETKKRGLTPIELLDYLRDEICKQVLAEPEQRPLATTAKEGQDV
jgi:hypothetical protein